MDYTHHRKYSAQLHYLVKDPKLSPVERLLGFPQFLVETYDNVIFMVCVSTYNLLSLPLKYLLVSRKTGSY